MIFNLSPQSMENQSKSDFLSKLKTYTEKGWISSKIQEILEEFYLAFIKALKDHQETHAAVEKQFLVFLDLVYEQEKKPFDFQPYHQRVRKPFDYYSFGNDFFRLLVDFPHSSILGLSHLKEIDGALKKGENVILLANHQSELDPQAMSLLLEKDFPKLAEEMIFVAGTRVVTDPLAIPFSMGRNLLCIYSKRYIDFPPEEKASKQLHNKRTMKLMSDLLAEGGKIIYVAPSGGRDRANSEGVVEIAPFDPNSIEMFYLMAQKAHHPTHFYPLTVSTYELLPPPATVQIELGEKRIAQMVDIHMAFGAKIDMEHFPGYEVKDKHERRQNRANYIWNLVKDDYEKILSSRHCT
jgi:glycerol-3-phosphate O-acyltransferase